MSPRVCNVYLAGSISSLTLAESRDGWRAEFARRLRARKTASHIHLLSPARSEPRNFKGKFETDGKGMPISVLTRNGRSVTAKDLLDIRRSELMIASYLDCEDVMSLGTAFERGYAMAHNVDVLTIGNPTSVNLSHLLLAGSAGFHADTVAEAVKATVLLLSPGL